MKKRLLSIISLVLVILMLAACGGGAKQSSAPASTAPASTAPESKAPESTEPAPEAAPTTDWPTKPVTLIVPAAAGGDTDVNTRVFAKYLQEELGQTVIISNIKGTAVAHEEFLNAPNDGYTAMIFHNGYISSNVLGTIDLPLDKVEMVNAISIDKQSAYIVSKDSPLKSMQDLIDASKDHPVSFATEVGSMSHLTELAFMNLIPGSQLQIVDAGGSAEKIAALLSGDLDLMFNQLGLVKDYITNGDFIPLAVMSDERSPFWPDVPTFKECGVDMNFDKPYILYFEEGTDKAIVEKMNEALMNVCANPDYAAELEEIIQSVPGDMTHEECIKWCEDSFTLYTQLLKDAGLI